MAGKVKQCGKKFSGKSQGQRRARQRCIARAKEGSDGGSHKGDGSPAGSPGSSAPPPTPIPSPTPTPSPGPSPPPSPTVPDTAIDSAPSGPIAQRDVSVSFHSNPSGASFQCSLNGAAWSACASPAHYSSLADGSYEFAVRALEGESIDPTPATASFKVEATPPQTTITSAPNGRVPTGAVSVDFSSDESGSTFECGLDGASFSSCASPYELPSPAPGPHDLKVRAVNGAGVVDPSPSSANWSSVEPEHDLCGSISLDTTIGPDYAAVYVLTCSLTIEEGATLNAEPGVIVKGEDGVAISVRGALEAVGTASEPVAFTSVNDNSVGGNTGTGSPQAGEWEGIDSEGGNVDLEHADIRYGIVSTFNGGGELTLADSTLLHTGVYVSEPDGSPGQTRIVDNTLQGATENYGGGELLRGTLISVRLGVSSPSPTITGNRVEGALTFPIALAGPDLHASDLSGNTGSGNGDNYLALSGGLTGNWSIAGDDLQIASLNREENRSQLRVKNGATLHFGAGAVFKSFTTNWCFSCTNANLPSGLNVEEGGTLEAQGTASEPVAFTSVNDNSVGGNTGTGSPQAGEWEGIGVIGEGSSLDLDHAQIEYAQTALEFASEVGRLSNVSIAHSSLAIGISEGSISFRGSLTNNTSDVEACSWQSADCSVDAAYTYWGSSEGAFPSGSPALACGAVTTSPYLTSESGASTANGSVFGTANCDGSETPEQLLASAQQAADTHIAAEQIRCGEGFEEACQIIQLYQECLGAATTLAQSQSPFPFSDPKDVASTGADWLASSENAVVSDLGQVASFGLGIVGAAKTITDIANAYGSCG